MLPPINVGQQAITANGRPYSGTPGTAQDVPDMDARNPRRERVGKGRTVWADHSETIGQSDRDPALHRRTRPAFLRHDTQRGRNFRRRDLADTRWPIGITNKFDRNTSKWHF